METRSHRSTIHAWPPQKPNNGSENKQRAPDMPRGSVKNLIEVYEKRIRDSSQEPDMPRRQTVGVMQRHLNEEYISENQTDLPEQENPIPETNYSIQIQDEVTSINQEPQREIEEVKLKLDIKKRSENTINLENKNQIEIDTPVISKFKLSTEGTFSLTFKSTENYGQEQSPMKRYSTTSSDLNSPVFSRIKALSSTLYTQNLKDEFLDVDVLCVNCYECIPMDEVDAHSNVCVKPSIEESEYSVVDVRVRKILNSLSQRLYEAVGDRLLTIMQLQELANAIIETSLDSSSILDRLDLISASSLTMSDGYSCLIYSKRLSNLVEAKGPFSPAKDELTGDQLIKAYEEEAERQKKELERWRLRSELLLQLAGNSGPQELEDVTSDMGSDAERLSVVSYSTGLSDFNSDIGNIEDAESIFQAISEEELEKYFYSICIKKKLELSKNHPAHARPISKLYADCKTEKIPVSQWEDFIKTALN